VPKVPVVAALVDRHARRHVLRATAVLALAAFAAGAAAARTLHLAATECPPYYSPSLPGGGPVAQLTLAALRQAGYQVELRFLPWARALRLGEQGQVDGLVGVWHSPQREAAFLYSLPVVSNRIVLCGLQGRMPARFTSFEALRPQVIGIVRGYANPPALADAQVRTEEVDNDLQNLRKLQAERIDLVLIDSRVERYLERESLPRGGARIGCLEPAVQEQPQYLVVSRQARDAALIVDAFNAQLSRMISSGDYTRIAEQAGL
jgi:polar amino acid transport system substrate-binding protein